MSYVLLTHPRSGSTKIIRCISSYLKLQNFGEFFYLHNSLNYGDIRLYRTGNFKKYNTYIFSNNQLSNYVLDINNQKDLDKFLLDECDNRIRFLNSLDPDTFILKYFFDDKISPSFYQAVEENVLMKSRFKKVFLYRRNILDAILSLIIKDRIINQRSFFLDTVNFNKIGHNYGSMEKLYPKIKINITENQLRSYSTMFINFFNFLKTVPDPVLLCYEDIFQNDSFMFDNKNIPLNLDSEIPMNYGIDKKDFFSNIGEIQNYFNQTIKDQNLEELFCYLNISYD